MRKEVEAARHKGRNGRCTEKKETNTKKNREQKTDNLRLDYTTMKKRVKCFNAVQTTPEKLKNATTTSHIEFAFERNSARKIFLIIVTTLLSKTASFSKRISSSLKEACKQSLFLQYTCFVSCIVSNYVSCNKR